MRDRREMDNPRIPRIPRIPGFPGFLADSALIVRASVECILPYYGPYLEGTGPILPYKT